MSKNNDTINKARMTLKKIASIGHGNLGTPANNVGENALLPIKDKKIKDLKKKLLAIKSKSHK